MYLLIDERMSLIWTAYRSVVPIFGHLDVNSVFDGGRLGTERWKHTGLPSALETSSSFGQALLHGKKLRQGKWVGDKFQVKNFVWRMSRERRRENKEPTLESDPRNISKKSRRAALWEWSGCVMVATQWPGVVNVIATWEQVDSGHWIA